VPGGKDGTGGGLKNSRSSSLLPVPYFCSFSIKCVGVTVEAQAQNVYHKLGIITWRSAGKKASSAGGRKDVGMDPKLTNFYYVFFFKNNAFTAYLI